MEVEEMGWGRRLDWSGSR